MTKQCEKYDFEIEVNPVKLRVWIKPHKDDMWTGFRILANMGKRISSELKCIVSVDASTIPESHSVGVVFTPVNAVSKETMENAAHSLYLWIEHPEKY